MMRGRTWGMNSMADVSTPPPRDRQRPQPFQDRWRAADDHGLAHLALGEPFFDGNGNGLVQIADGVYPVKIRTGNGQDKGLTAGGNDKFVIGDRVPKYETVEPLAKVVTPVPTFVRINCNRGPDVFVTC
jgi:hypothetical protein